MEVGSFFLKMTEQRDAFFFYCQKMFVVEEGLALVGGIAEGKWGDLVF